MRSVREPLPVGAPPLHADATRHPLVEADGWQVRRFALDDERFAYLARHGMLHLQLWHPRLRASILTPSALTGGQVDVWVAGRGRGAVRDYATLATIMRAERVAPLAPAYVRALVRWLVEPHEPPHIRLRRAWWCA